MLLPLGKLPSMRERLDGKCSEVRFNGETYHLLHLLRKTLLCVAGAPLMHIHARTHARTVNDQLFTVLCAT